MYVSLPNSFHIKNSDHLHLHRMPRYEPCTIERFLPFYFNHTVEITELQEIEIKRNSRPKIV